MSKDGLKSPILAKYLKAYQKNPKSRVFAPLAEAYRRLDMVEKALEVLKDGIRHNPSYTMGYLGLAFCYYDVGQFTLAHSTLAPLVANNRDNIRLQKLFGGCCVELGHHEEALETYKYILFINPKDEEAAVQVKKIEEMEFVSTVKDEDLDGPDQFDLFDLENLSCAPSDDKNIDKWVQVDFGQADEEKVDENSDWEMEQSSVSDIEEELDRSEEEEKEELEVTGLPVPTHTLVDLYCSQGHTSKAIEVLEQIVERDESDDRALKRLISLQEELVNGEPVSDDMVDEIELDEEQESILEESNEGRDQLMNLVDSTLDRVTQHDSDLVVENLNEFLSAIKHRAEHIRENR